MNELWYYNFSENDKQKKAPNIMKLIERYDKLIFFIIEDICCYDGVKIRAELITKWTNIAKKCKELRNFTDSLIIIRCLTNSLIKKLVLTWKKVPDSTINSINELNKFFSPQNCYINIRKMVLKCKTTSYIPFLGTLLQEMIDIEEKNKYMLNSSNINCVKLQKIYFSVQKFFTFKNFSFSFKQNKELDVLNNINPKNENELEQLINQIEPKQRIFKIFKEKEHKKRLSKSDEAFYQ